MSRLKKYMSLPVMALAVAFIVTGCTMMSSYTETGTGGDPALHVTLKTYGPVYVKHVDGKTMHPYGGVGITDVALKPGRHVVGVTYYENTGSKIHEGEEVFFEFEARAGAELTILNGAETNTQWSPVLVDAKSKRILATPL